MSTKPREGMGAEDFAYFVTPESGVKGVYFSVGGTPAAEARHRSLASFAAVQDHAGAGDPDPRVEAMTAATIALMGEVSILQ